MTSNLLFNVCHIPQKSEYNSTYILSIHSSVWNSVKLEQLERLRSEDTPAASWLPIQWKNIGWISCLTHKQYCM